MFDNNSYPLNYELKDKEYRKLVKIVYDSAGINLGDNKQELVHARLGKILRKRNIRGFDEYIKLLSTDTSGDELVMLLDAIATNVTHFFRESDHFDFITQQFSEVRNPSEIRIWSAGCSSGEEPYSIAITLCELFGNCPRPQSHILATDISTRILDRAKRGVYPRKVIENLDLSLLKKYFLKGKGNSDGLIKVRKEIIGMVTFQRLNLVEPFNLTTQFDVIFCRNVMIYFDNSTRQSIVENFNRALKPGGILIIGHSESLNGIRHPFKYLKPTIYVK